MMEDVREVVEDGESPAIEGEPLVLQVKRFRVGDAVLVVFGHATGFIPDTRVEAVVLETLRDAIVTEHTWNVT